MTDPDSTTDDPEPGRSLAGPKPWISGPIDSRARLRVPRAQVVAAVLTAHGIPVNSPDEGSLDDREMECWEACLEIVDRLCEPEAA